MKNSKSETSIIKDTAVFDYVAGKQSEGAVKNFEKLLEQDTDLAQDVEIEKQLRSALAQANPKQATAPVSMKNFDALLERIDIEADEVSNANTTDGSDLSSGIDSADNVVVVKPWRWQRQFNIAASFAVIAMIGVIGFNQTTEPDFVTLSNQAASSEIDFAGLVDQQRMVKIELAQGLTSTEISALLGGYQLQPIQSNVAGQTVLASSKQALNAEQLAVLANDKRVTNAELVSFGTK